jgi:5-methylcytosine-specific restriction protein A
MPHRPPIAFPRAKKLTPYRGSSTDQGYGSAHRRWRAEILKRDPVCKIQVKCNGAPSTVADHVTPLKQGGTWDYSNGAGVCNSCHQWKRATTDKHPPENKRPEAQKERHFSVTHARDGSPRRFSDGGVR